MDNKMFGGKVPGREGIPMDLAQQVLLASQLGIPPAMLDPSLQAGMLNSPQGALALQQQMMGLQGLAGFNPASPFSFGAGANALPPNAMNNVSQRALDAMTQEINNQMLASNMLSAGGQDPLALAQQAQLLASLNGYVPPAMLSQMFNPFLNQNLPPSMQKEKGHKKGNQKPNNMASTSRETSNRYQSESTSKSSSKHSKSPHNTKLNNNLSSEQLYKALTNQHQSGSKKAHNEQAMQAEMVHQLEQQLLMHQLQLQQHQEHIQEAIKNMNKPNSEMSSLQQQLTQSMYQQSLMSPSNALNPALSDYMLNSQLMAMGQLPNNFLKDSNYRDTRNKSSESKQSPNMSFLNNSNKTDTISKLPVKVSSPKRNKHCAPSKSSPNFNSFLAENKKEEKYHSSHHKTKHEATHSKQDLPISKIKKEPSDFSQNAISDAIFKEMLANNKAQNVHQKFTPSTNSTRSKDPKDFSTLNERDFFLGLQTMLSAQSNNFASNSNSEPNPIEKAMKSAYDDIVQNTQNCDLNKMNEVLAGIVAAEMQRLQEQQVNLTRELDLLNQTQEKKSIKSEPDNRVSVIHKAKPKENNRESASISNFDKLMNHKVDADLFVPLDKRWKRETRFKCGNQGIKAYVVYISPHGDTLRNLEDISNYLKENNVKDLQKHNFSFDYHFHVGSYYEQGDQQFNKITNEEQIQTIIQMVDNFGDLTEQSDKNLQRKRQKLKNKTEAVKQSNEEKLKMEIASLKEAADLKLKQRAQEKMLRQQERQQRLEQQRLEREAREQQLIEEREMRKQHLIFLKALETKKRALEKDRRREEIRNERIYMRERKMEQRRLAMELARQLKMPVEDMCLKDNIPLPKLTSLIGVKPNKDSVIAQQQLSGDSVADVLMVMEFVHNFKEAIHIEESAIPTITQIHLGLLNDPNHTDALVKLTIVLLHQCLCDPGVPAPGPWLHCATGLKVTDIDVSKDNYSEILRLFLWARHGFKTDIALELETEPFLALTSDQKTSTLAFLVNELVCSRPIYVEIERHLEKLSSLRRDKWVVEGKIRQVRIEHANDESDASVNSSPQKPKPKLKSENTEEEEEKEDKESVKDDEDSNATDEQKCKKDSVMEQKMKRLTKEHHSFNDRLFVSSKPLRALNMGQDRFKRRYWILSNLGGVYVEGLESGCCHDDKEFEELKTEESDSDELKITEKSQDMQIDINNETKEVAKDISQPENCIPEKSSVISIGSDLKSNDHNSDDEISFVKGNSNNVENITISTKPRQLDIEMTNQNTVKNPCIQDHDKNTTQPNFHSNLSNVDRNVLSQANNSDNTLEMCINISSNILCTTNCSSTNSIRNNSIDPVIVDLTRPDMDNEIYSKTIKSPISQCSPQNKSHSENNKDQVISMVIEKETEIQNHVDQTSTNQSLSSDLNRQNILTSVSNANSTDDTNLTNQNNTVPKPENLSTLPISSCNNYAVDCPKNIAMDMTQKSKETESINLISICTSSDKLVPENALTNNKTKPEPIAAPTQDLTSSNYSISKTNELEDNKVHSTDKSLKTVLSLPSKSMQNGSAVTTLKTETSSLLKNHNIYANTQINEKEDCVLIAAKAIAAKAVASSSHILFPKSNMVSSPVKKEKGEKHANSKRDNIHTTREQRTDQPIKLEAKPRSSNFTKDVKNLKPHSNSVNGIGSLTSNVLQSLGLYPTDLTQEQISALLKMDQQQHSSIPKQCNQDTAIDLSKPTTKNLNQHSFKLENSSDFIPIPNFEDVKREILTPVDNSMMEMDMKMDYYNPMMKSELAMMEQLNEFNQKSVLKEPLQIPKDMKQGWWKIDDEKLLHNFADALHSRGAREKYLKNMLSKYGNYCSETIELSGEEKFQFIEKLNQENIEVDEKNDVKDSSKNNHLESATETSFRIEIEILNQVKDLATRLVNVGILRKDWLQLHSVQLNRDNLEHIPYVKQDDIKHDCTNPIKHHPSSVLSVAVELLSSLELCIPRNYLKPPLIRKGGASEFSNLPSLSEAGASDVAAGLRSWRNAVATALSGSQLAMCVAMLNTSLAWERSPITFGAKTKKRKCDKRVASKLQVGETKKRKTKSSEMLQVDKTNLSYRSKSILNGENSQPESNTHNNPTTLVASNNMDLSISDENQTKSPVAHNDNINHDKKKHKKKKNQQEKPKPKKSHATFCKTLLKELQAHEMATWFLFPVDTKVIPEYRKVIKKPIDFNTIQNRLKKGRYKDPDLFASDVRLVFDNCKLYNTDDSPIGQAGHALRSVFEDRWLELENEKIENPSSSI